MLYQATIEGITAILQHRFSEAAQESGKTRKINIVMGTPRDEAEKVCYRTPDGVLYFPGAAIARLLREAGGAHKQRGSRKSIKFVIPAAVLVPDEIVKLHDAAGNSITEFEVDSRPVTIPATKGRIMRHRPRIEKWRATFSLEIDTELLDASLINQLLTEAGRSIGLGDFRPERGGPFGRFILVSWAAAEQPVALAAD